MTEAKIYCQICKELKFTTLKQVVLVEEVGVVMNVCIGCEEEMKLGSKDSMPDGD